MKKIFSCFIVAFPWFLVSQQLPQLTQFSTNLSFFNPSAMGLNENPVITLGGRWQMLGFGSEPRSLFFGGSAKLNIKKTKNNVNAGLRIDENERNLDTLYKTSLTHHLGGQFIYDQYGAFGRTGIIGNYSLGINLNHDWKAHFGARFGWSNFSFNQNKAQVLNIIDPYSGYQGGDEVYDQYISGNNKRNSFDLGLGLTLIHDKYILGFAMNQITKSLFDISQNSSTFYDQRLHWNFFTGYNFDIPEICELQGMILVKKMEPTPLSLELSLKANFPNNLWGGIHYRNKSSIGIMGGFLINEKIQMGYSIDFETTRIRKFSNGGHELILNYRFGE